MIIVIINFNTKGGMVHYISQLSNALIKRSSLYIIAQKGIEKRNFNDSIKIIQLETGNTKRNFILNTVLIHKSLKFLNIIHQINPDIIHLQSCHLWVCLFLPFLKKYKIVTTIHDVTPHMGSRFIDQEISRKVHIKYSDALIVHGQNAKRMLAKECDNKKIFIVPHGDYSFFSKLGNYKHEEEPFSLLFFGRIEAYKGLTYLIQAVPLIASKIPNLKVIIAGSGDLPEKDKIEKSPHFEIHNYFIEDQEVGKFFARSAVVILPYLEGTQTGIIPIAYSFKKPVIVTNVGCIPEVVDEGITGYIVPPRNPRALANAIIKILSDDYLRRQMGQNAYQKMRNELSWDNIADNTLKIYEDLLEAKYENNKFYSNKRLAN